MHDLLTLVVSLRSLTQQLQSQILDLNKVTAAKAAHTGLAAGWLAYLLGVVSPFIVGIPSGFIKLLCCLIAVLAGCSALHSRKIMHRTENQRPQVEAIYQKIEDNLRYLESLANQ